MVRPKITALALLCGGIASVGFAPALRAVTSSLEVLPAERAGDGSDSVDVGGLKSSYLGPPENFYRAPGTGP